MTQVQPSRSNRDGALDQQEGDALDARREHMGSASLVAATFATAGAI